MHGNVEVGSREHGMAVVAAAEWVVDCFSPDHDDSSLASTDEAGTQEQLSALLGCSFFARALAWVRGVAWRGVAERGDHLAQAVMPAARSPM